MSKFTILRGPTSPVVMIGICTCGYSADVNTFEQEHTGWEIVEIDLICPKCDDGGCVDDFIYPNEGCK